VQQMNAMQLMNWALYLSLCLNGASTAASTVHIIFPLGFVGEGGRGRESYAQCVGYYSTVAEHHGPRSCLIIHLFQFIYFSLAPNQSGTVRSERGLHA